MLAANDTEIPGLPPAGHVVGKPALLHQYIQL